MEQLSRSSDLISNSTVLIDHWRAWEGAVDCGLSGRRWPAAKLRDLADDAAEVFASLGMQPGDPVVLMLTNTAGFPVCLTGLLIAGCNPLLAFAGTPKPVLDRLLGEFGIRHILHDFIPDITHLVSDAYPEIGGLAVGSIMVSVLENSGATAPSDPVPGQGVILLQTSGTFGTARFCLRDQEAVIAEGRNYVDSIDLYDRARVTVTTPLTHSFALGAGLIASILTHSTLAIDAAFNPKRVLRLEKEAPSDILAIVPPMAKALLQLGRFDPDRRMARAVFYAGSPISSAIADEFQTAFGTPLFTILGTTETGGICTSYSPVGPLNGVGRPMRHVDISLSNKDSYSEFGDGVGELHVRSPAIMQGYWPGAGIDRPQGFFPTGDIGFIDDTASLVLVGRIRDIINLGGMKVDPLEVEAVLLQHPAIEDAVAYPGLRTIGEEFVQAAIVAADVDAASLRSYCLEQLDAYKVPAVFHFVDRLPRSPSGKCLKVQCPDFPLAVLGRKI